MLATERIAKPPKKSTETAPFPSSNEGLFLIASLKAIVKSVDQSPLFNRLKNFSSELTASITKRRKFRIWDSRPYFDAGRQTFGEEQNKIHLQDELITFFDEYAALNPRKKYEEYGIKGRGNRNALATSDLCDHFAEALMNQNKNADRAHLETWMAQTFESFLKDENIPDNSLLISISPRGSIEEGYPGLDQKNYVFINVYVKKGTTATLHQFTSYATTEQLQSQHDEINSILTGSSYQPTSPPAAYIKTPEHALISQPILIQKNQEAVVQILNTIETILYQNQDDWPTRIEDLPEINMEEYEIQSKEITAHILAIFNILTVQQVNQEITQEEAISKMDSFIMISRKYLLKWVEMNAINYQNARRSKRQTPLPTIQELVASWKENHILHDTSSEKQNTPRLSLVVSSLEVSSKSLLQASSAAHCVLGTPSSLAMQVAKIPQAPSSMPGVLGPANMMSLKSFRATNAFSGKKNPEKNDTKHELNSLLAQLKELKNIQTKLVPITITNRQTQTNETIYIWFSDPTYASEYATGCYRKTSSGKVFGPCDVLLEDDDLIQLFNWKMGKKKYLDESEYQSLLAHLFEVEMMILLEQFTEDSNSAHALHRNVQISEKQRAQLTEIVKKLSSRIFRVTLSDLVAGVIDYTEEFLSLPARCITFLQNAGPNKIAALNQLLLILEQDDINTILGQLALKNMHSITSPDAIGSHAYAKAA